MTAVKVVVGLALITVGVIVAARAVVDLYIFLHDRDAAPDPWADPASDPVGDVRRVADAYAERSAEWKAWLPPERVDP